MFRKILIANRGEIAVRVMRTARRMGVKTVAVFSEADRDALHTKLADEAVFIGEAESAKSYLVAETILRTAQESGAEAVHPGYGFLSERSSFARACREVGVTFIGPSPEAMDRLGAKIDAKKLAVENGVPVTPGFFESGATADQLREAAEKIGYPVMLKASAGGGGRGMRVVRDPKDFDSELALASEEAVKGFGDGAMMVEKLVERPRHIEVQLLADSHGNVATLFERECTLQRRHQKIVEEAPSPVMTDELWQRMSQASRTLANAAGYVGAGTVEFMVDDAGRDFYFLEVNARLQVEHPVTEAITGLDLVEWQLRIASGERLALSDGLMAADRSAILGHAIETRLVAEDPGSGFLPSVGAVVGWAEPKGPGIRFDTGFGPGTSISRYYDSLIGKLIVHGQNRKASIERLVAALEDTHILGVKTNIEYLLDILKHPDFATAKFDTGWLGRELADWHPPTDVSEALLALVQAASQGRSVGSQVQAAPTAWGLADGFQNAKSS